MWTFDPTADLHDFDEIPGLRDAWGVNLNSIYDENINGAKGAVSELRAWGASDSDLRFYNPLVMEVPTGAVHSDVTWSALPSRYNDQFHGDLTKVFDFLDSAQHDPQAPMLTRMQDEYCEWVIAKDQNGKITRVIFTSEPGEYYSFLFNPPPGINRDQSQALLVKLYQQATGVTTLTKNDLLNGAGEYDYWNQWNNKACVHMQQPNNSLGAEVNIAARAAILRTRGGHLLTDAQDLIQCAQYGDGNRQSDPAIGAAVNAVAVDNRFITLENPVGLYMTSLDTTGWSTPDGTDAKTFWRVVRGSDVNDPTQNTIVRAEYAVPLDKGYTVSDIQIAGNPISHGGQIAAHITMRLGVLVGPASNLPRPRAIGCIGQQPVRLAHPVAQATARGRG